MCLIIANFGDKVHFFLYSHFFDQTSFLWFSVRCWVIINQSLGHVQIPCVHPWHSNTCYFLMSYLSTLKSQNVRVSACLRICVSAYLRICLSVPILKFGFFWGRKCSRSNVMEVDIGYNKFLRGYQILGSFIFGGHSFLRVIHFWGSTNSGVQQKL